MEKCKEDDFVNVTTNGKQPFYWTFTPEQEGNYTIYSDTTVTDPYVTLLDEKASFITYNDNDDTSYKFCNFSILRGR